MDYQGDYGGGGGGFDTGGDAYGAASSQGGGGGGGRRNYDEQTVIPVTARMVLAAKHDETDANTLKLEDDRKLAHIKLVGAIRNVEEASTSVVYQVEDGTGLVEVKQWLDETDCTAAQEIRQSTMREHIYVKIIGQVKEYNQTRTVVASSVRPLTSGNQLAHHFLEVVYSGEKFKNTSSIVQPASPMDISGSNGVGFGGSSGGMRAPVVQQGGSGDALRDSVFNFIKEAGGTFLPCCYLSLFCFFIFCTCMLSYVTKRFFSYNME